MSWITPRQAISMLGMKKLSQLTNEIGQPEFLGVGDAAEDTFVTPFVFGSDIKVYADGTLAGGYTFAIDYDNEERIVVTFTAPPATGVQLTVSSTDSVNAVNLEDAFLRAQGLVRGALSAQLYVVPDDDALLVPEPLIGWTGAITWYLLASDPRRPRLLEAYPELEKRYLDVYGGVDSDLKRVAKGMFSLRGILQTIDLAADPDASRSEFVSNDVVYTSTRFRSVL